MAKSGKVRRFINENINKLKLIVPNYAIEEVNKFLKENEEYLARKGSPKNLLEMVLFRLATYLIVLPEYFYKDVVKLAKEIAKNFDEKDIPFIALALKFNIPIWSGDKDMIIYGLKTNKYLAIDTKALKDLLEGKPLEEIKEDLKKRYL